MLHDGKLVCMYACNHPAINSVKAYTGDQEITFNEVINVKYIVTINNIAYVIAISDHVNTLSW